MHLNPGVAGADGKLPEKQRATEHEGHDVQEDGVQDTRDRDPGDGAAVDLRLAVRLVDDVVHAQHHAHAGSGETDDHEPAAPRSSYGPLALQVAPNETAERGGRVGGGGNILSGNSSSSRRRHGSAVRKRLVTCIGW